MRIIQAEEVISTFITKIKSSYPHLSDKELERVCRAEFLMLKETMQSGSLEEVRLQYLFTVRVSPQKIMKQLHYMDMYRYKINTKSYKKYLIMILNYVNKNNKIFKKYEDKISKYTGFTPREIEQREYISNGPSLTS